MHLDYIAFITCADGARRSTFWTQGMVYSVNIHLDSAYDVEAPTDSCRIMYLSICWGKYIEWRPDNKFCAHSGHGVPVGY